MAETCPSTDTFSENGCAAGEFAYHVTIETSVVLLGDIRFEVQSSASVNYVATGTSGFAILNSSGIVLAEFQAPNGLMSMTESWSTYSGGVNPSTPLTTIDTLLIDMGTANPHDQGYWVYADGTGSYAGTTSAEELP